MTKSCSRFSDVEVTLSKQPNQLHVTCRQNIWVTGRQNEAFESKQAETTIKRQEMMRTRFLNSWRPVFCF